MISLAASTESLTGRVAGMIVDSVVNSVRLKTKDRADVRLRTHDSWEQTCVGLIGLESNN